MPKRFNKWDIPKGKIEENESASCAAIREIQEECGLQELIIQNSLTPTYHVYFGYGEYMIKKTHWFSLTTEETITKGQVEEDITEVEWFQPTALESVKQHTFLSIVSVMNEYLENDKE